MDFDRLTAFLERRSLMLGSGLYSRVYGREGSHTVIKLLARTLQPDRWPVYIEWAERNGFAGGLAPKVYALRRDPESGRYAAVIERLKPVPRDYDDEGNYPAVSGLARDLGDNLYYGCLRRQVDAKLLRRHAPGWRAFATKFKEAFRGESLDLHLGNWMLRGEHLVLTDPITQLDSPSYPEVMRLRRGEFTYHNLER